MGHGTKVIGAGFESVEAIAELQFDKVKGVGSKVGQFLLAQFFPKILGRIELWAVGRQRQEADVFRHNQARGQVPSGTIEQHDDEFVWKFARELLEEERHGMSVRIRNDDRAEQAKGWTNSSKDIEILANDLIRSLNSNTTRAPATSCLADSTKPPFILSENQNFPFVFFWPFFEKRIYLLWKAFLNSSCSALEDFTCAGRATFLLHSFRSSNR